MEDRKNEYTHYEASAEKLRIINKRFSVGFWLNIAIALLSCAVGILTTALLSNNIPELEGMRDRYDEADSFVIEYSVSLLNGAGFGFVVLFAAILIVVLSLFSATKMIGPTAALTAVFSAALLVTAMSNLPYRFFYIFASLLGGGYNAYLLTLYKSLNELKQLPGYPHFNVRFTESQKPREEIDLSAARNNAPMDMLETPSGMAPLAADHSLDHILSQRQVTDDDAPSLRSAAAHSSPYDNLSKADALSDIIAPEIEDLSAGSDRGSSSDQNREALPTLDEIRKRYGQ